MPAQLRLEIPEDLRNDGADGLHLPFWLTTCISFRRRRLLMKSSRFNGVAVSLLNRPIDAGL
jgi:hypothetical protein